MPVGINQPSNQIKLTNVSLVRLKKGKKRFELACYKNKLLEYRSGEETDLDNVLQIPTVFLSVSKGQTAPSADLAKSFGANASREDVIQEILRRGELQVGEKERKELLDRVEKEVLEMVSSRLVDPTSKRVYTTGMIGKALDQLSAASGQQGGKQPQQLHQQLQNLQLQQKTGDASGGGGSGADTPVSSTYDSPASTSQVGTPAQQGEDGAAATRKALWTGVVANKSAKIQALDAMKALIAWQPIPVMRARMRLRITCPTSLLKQAARSSTAASGGGASGNNGSATPSKGKGKGKKGKKPAGDDSEEEGDSGKGAASNTASGTVKDRILGYMEQVESQDVLGDEWEVVGFAEPGAFKALGEFVGGETKGKGRVEVLDMAVTHEEE